MRLAIVLVKSILTAWLVVAAVPSYGVSGARNAMQGPRDVSYCELSRNPSSFDHQLVRVTGFITHGFEDFHFADPECPTQGFSVWIMYGGKAQSGTMYCCPGEGGEKARSEPLSVEGVQVPLIDDVTFQQFAGLISKKNDTTIYGTFVGWFFSGKKQEINGRTFWGGAGHMGCCSLLVIQRVESFKAHSRSDLDYTSEAGWYESEGCKYGTLRDLRHVSIVYADGNARRAIEQQRSADSGDFAWRFNDPQQVALEALKPFYHGQNPAVKKVKNTRSRQVFRWTRGDKRIVVVVTRPYWLSFYAASDAVIWVATMIKEAGCGS